MFDSYYNDNINILAKWRWSTNSTRKATAIDVSHDALTAKRQRGGNQNPAIMTSEPLTRFNCFFLVQIVKLGDWVSIVVSTPNVNTRDLSPNMIVL